MPRACLSIPAIGGLLLSVWIAVPAAQRTATTSATVLVRVSGRARAEFVNDRITPKQTIDLPQGELGSGTGFVISRYGYILTNHHVIASGTIRHEIRGEPVDITMQVQRVEVLFAPGSGDADSIGSIRRFTASVIASDPDLDLAVLYVSAPELPYVPFGDSDAVEASDAGTVIGYPFGRLVDVGNAATPEVAPSLTTNPSSISSLRADPSGDLRYLQMAATVNPGNSGGPLLDREGYVIGVVQMKVRDASAVSFAIPINLVKAFLARSGLDQTLPSRSLALGGLYSADGKGLRMPLPSGWRDVSPHRVRIDSGVMPENVSLHVDRVISPWDLDRLEETLLTGGLEAGSFARDPMRPVTVARPDSVRARAGRATGAGREGEELKIEYRIVDLGREKVIARYVGPAEQMAANRSVLQRSLGSLEADVLITADVNRAPDLRWQTVSLPTAAGVEAWSVPAGWAVQPGMLSGCPNLPPVSAGLAASPARDFSVEFRAGWWPAGVSQVESASAECVANRGAYAARIEWLGVTYAIEGTFVPLASGRIVQFEVIAPDAKIAFVRELFAQWVKVAAK